MPATFTRTLRSISSDRSRRRTMELVIAALLIGGWLAWFLLGGVAVYEVTERARIEVEIAAHSLAAPVGGRVVTAQLQLGREVKAGEILVELDAATEELALAEARARHDGLLKRLEKLRLEIEEEKNGLERHREASEAAIEEAKSRVTESEAIALKAAKELETARPLKESGVVAPEAFMQYEATAKATRAAADARELATKRLDSESALERSDRRAGVLKLELQEAELQGQAGEINVTIRKLEHEVERRRIRSPIDGVVGRATELRKGSVVQTAEVLGAIVPPGKARVVAFFPVPAVGRIRPGQDARLRMDGFPWTQFGMPRAKVTDVGNEPADGRVRVELELDRTSAPAIPFEHGLSGTAEVEVESASPAVLVLRAVGKLLTTKRTAGP